MVMVKDKETCIQAIKNIGQDLIDRAEDITNDIEGVQSISIYANITPLEIVNFDITKNYVTKFKK